MLAAGSCMLQLSACHLCFRIVAPGAAKITALRKYGRPQPRPVMDAESLQIADKQRVLIHLQSFFQ